MALVKASIRRAARYVGRGIAETLYPKTCAGCGMRGMWLCEMCEEDTLLLGLSGSCPRCGEPLMRSRCGCADLTADIVQARAVAVYDGWAATAVRRVKYDNEPDRARHLAAMMQRVLATLGPVDGLVPVPLHPAKLKERGFNQSTLIASHLSAASGVPVVDMLTRTKKTVSQTTLTGRQRRENVADVFAVDARWHPRPGRRYVLVDDVRTTGATLSACAKALGAAAPARISVLTFALDMQAEELEAYREAVRIGAVSP
jgi:competence protein ComFC